MAKLIQNEKRAINCITIRLYKQKFKELYKIMVSTAIRPQEKVSIKEVKENLLTPRFYTTDFKAIAKMDVSAQREQLEAMLEEMKADYNRRHFMRDDDFEQSWDHIDETTRRAFVEFSSFFLSNNL